MNTKYWTKDILYKQVDALSNKMLSAEATFPISSYELAEQHCENVDIRILDMNTMGICGILLKGETTTSIALNAQREGSMQNFDCMHELIHYFFHDIAECTRICSEEITLNSTIEWQANEGAAQFLAPYQHFIPKYVEISWEYNRKPWTFDIITALSEMYNLSHKTITNRIKGLQHAIWQYMNGVPIEKSRFSHTASR